MEKVPVDSSIAKAYFACVDAFTQILHAASAHTTESWELDGRALRDEFDKYKLWAGNLGAMHSGPTWNKSLDYRLRESSFFKEQVLRLLRDLEQATARAYQTIEYTVPVSDGDSDHDSIESAAEDSPWEVSSDSENGKTLQVVVGDHGHKSKIPHPLILEGLQTSKKFEADFQLIKFIIGCLWKLPIRRPAPLDRMKDGAVAETSSYQPFDIMHVKDKFPSISEDIATRLGKGISRRRQLLRYRKTHTNALQEKPLTSRHRVLEAKIDQDFVASENSSSFVTSSYRTQDTKATTLRPVAQDHIVENTADLYAPSISASISSAGSDQNGNDTAIVIPKRPKGADGEYLKQFVCPYCHIAQSITTDIKWMKHVLADLRPYQCTFEKCPLDDFVFENKEEWFRHEMQSHRCEWFCNDDAHKSFHDANEFLEHMKTTHGNSIHESQVSSLRHIFQRPTQTRIVDCNLCGKSTEKIKAHQAKHLKQLALFAIPQTDYMEESEGDGAHSDMANRSQEISEEHGLLSKTSTDVVEITPPHHLEDSVSQDTPAFDEGNTSDSSFPEEVGVTQDASWDYVTPKFREARDAMYGSEQPRMADTEKKPGMIENQNDDDMAVMNPYHQLRPLCGASIGAFRGEHLPPVSLGGIVLVDGEPYGLTVHHMIDAPSDDESEEEGLEDVANINKENDEKNEAEPRNDLSVSEDGKGERNMQEDKITWDAEKPGPIADPSDQALMKPSKSKDESSEFLMFGKPSSTNSESGKSSSIADSFDTDSDPGTYDSEEGGKDLHTFGDIPGISVGAGADIKVTQPGIDDVDEDFFPSEEDRDEDHLMSHEYGHIYASSGIRRIKHQGILQEVDWALIKVNDDRLQPYNVLQGGRRFSTRRKDDQLRPPLIEPVSRRYYTEDEDEYPIEVVDAASLGGLSVHCFGRTTGLQGGEIGSEMVSVKIYRRKTFSRSWFVKGGFGVGGDSGAWVVENGTGRVCGVVLTWDERNHVAYIQPMQLILDDIKRTLGAREVCLPSYKGKKPQKGLEAKGSAAKIIYSQKRDRDREILEIRQSKIPRFSTNDEICISQIINQRRVESLFQIHGVRWNTKGLFEYQLRDSLTGHLYEEGVWLLERDLQPE